MSALEPAIAQLVRRASDLIGERLDALAPMLLAQSGNVAVEAKADGTPVTEVDLRVDADLGAAITSAFPDHGVLSEERDTSVPATEWAWVIDPIDGTSNFIAGLPYWCVSVALTYRGSPVLGIVDAPALGRRYLAIKGEGALRDGTAMKVRPTVDWRDGSSGHLPVMLTTGTARRARNAGVRLNPRVMGSTALDLAMVAEGVAVASVAIRPHVWDIAAGILLVEEAGGDVVAVQGEPLLPLERGTDHANRSVTTAAAADGPYARDLATRLLRAT